MDDASVLGPERDFQDALLVTSAWHMQRAEASFLAVGVDVAVRATDHEVVDNGPPTPLELLPRTDGFEHGSCALKEWSGLRVYRLGGWAP